MFSDSMLHENQSWKLHLCKSNESVLVILRVVSVGDRLARHSIVKLAMSFSSIVSTWLYLDPL